MSTTARAGRPSTRAATPRTTPTERPSTRPSTRKEPPKKPAVTPITPSRVGVRQVAKKKRRDKAPAKFMLAMFFIVVVSSLAFGLLHDPAPPVEGDPPSIYDVKDGATSTNTGILRGR